MTKKKKREPVILDWHESKIKITEKSDGETSEVEVEEVPITDKEKEERKKKAH